MNLDTPDPTTLRPPPLAGEVPPMHAGELPKPPTAWPAPIGIIAIVLGSCAALQAGAGFLMPLFTGALRNIPRPRGQPDPFAAIDNYMGVLLPIYAVGLLISIFLVVSGAGIVRRRAWSRPAVFVWSILKILYAVAISTVTAMMQKSQMEAVIANASSSSSSTALPASGVMSGIGVGVAAFTAIFMLLWLAALPVFLMIWFTRPRIKAEVAFWRGLPVS